jgi:hypothetical protein
MPNRANLDATRSLRSAETPTAIAAAAGIETRSEESVSGRLVEEARVSRSHGRRCTSIGRDQRVDTLDVYEELLSTRVALLALILSLYVSFRMFLPFLISAADEKASSAPILARSFRLLLELFHTYETLLSLSLSLSLSAYLRTCLRNDKIVFGEKKTLR